MPFSIQTGRIKWVFPVSANLNFSNRRMRTRLSGGAAGAER
jgi:hypothetical protein